MNRTGISLETMLAAVAEAPDAEPATAWLEFLVDGVGFAVDARRVEAVIASGPLARVPIAPPGVLGVASVRGRMRIVVDPGGARPASSGRMIVLHGDGQIALLADEVRGVTADLDPATRMIDPDSLVDNRG